MFLALAWAAPGAQLWVAPPPEGNDTTGTGGAGAPYATINKALQSVAANDTTIKIKPGVYAETPNLSNLSGSFQTVIRPFTGQYHRDPPQAINEATARTR